MTADGLVPGQPAEPLHARRLVVIWAVLTVVAVPVVVLLLGPHLPPGNLSDEARDQRHVNIVLAALATPVLVGVWVYFVYTLAAFRQRGAALEDGPPLRGHTGTQVTWVVATGAIVIALAGWGTYELLGPAKGAGGGQGPDPLAVPKDAKSALQVQVIGQQWSWTFRYPGYGAFETPQLAIPAGRVVELHVTSLDVNHSFWAYELGVKADAIAGTDNVAFVRARHAGSFEIRCAELCGLWHGHMRTTGVVLSQPAFAAWVRGQEAANAPATKVLPPYSSHYFPKPLRRAG
ncbi:MAG: cytochrome c oxidase subunit [Solirubrobacteraceae bacterium]|jgi:cytochrome c oxidase subunit 2|nr:cytochrome c oxidase subunit [Solirubrobacteraceae bacterium]